MARLIVDHREIPSLPPGTDSLEQLLKHVEKTQLDPKSVIRQVMVDGIPILDGQVQGSSAAYGDISNRATIEILTCSIGEIAVESISEAIAYMDRVESLVPSVAASFQSVPGPSAFENLRQLYEGLYWLNLLINRLDSLFHPVSDSNQITGTSIAEHQKRFLSNIQQLVEAHERGDFQLLAELLEFEIMPLIPELKQLFVDMAKRAGQSQ